MKELDVGIVTCASMQKRIEHCTASLEGSFHILPIIPSCTFSVKIEVLRQYLDKSTAENDVTLLAYGVCHPQLLPLLAEYGGRVVKVEGSNCYEMFLGGEKYSEYHRKCYWMLNEPFFTKWKNELLVGFGAGASSRVTLIGDAFKKLVYLRFEKDELSLDIVEDFARTVGLEYEIYSADVANLKRLLEEALASAYSTRRAKAPKSSMHHPRESEMRTVLESIGEVIYKVDIHTKQFTFVSTQVRRILGYTPAEFLDVMNDNLRTPFYHEDDRQRVVAGRYEFLVKCLNEGMQEPYEAEYRAKRKNGDDLWVSESIYPSYSSDGTIESFVGKIADITKRKQADDALRRAKEELEMRVAERTAKLTKTTQELRFDMDKRRQAEEAVRHSEEKLRRMFESITDGITVTDLNGVIIECNNKTMQMHGFGSMNKILGKSALELIAQRDHEKAVVNMQKTLEAGSVRGIEYALLKADGSEFPGELSTSVLRDASGNPVSFIAVTRDISERKQVENAIRESEERFRNVYEESPIGIELYDSNGRLIHVNQACLDIFGVSNLREVKGFKLFDDPNVPDEEKERLRKQKKVRYEVPFDFENVRKHKLYETSKSGIIYLDVLITPLGLSRKEPLAGYLVKVQDITERKQAEIALRDSEEFNSSLLTNSPNPILVFNADASIRYVNPALEKLTGFSCVELIGRKPPYPWWIEEIAGKSIAKLVKTGHRGVRKHEQVFKKRSGESFWVEITSEIVKVNGEFNYHLVNWVDITEEKRLKENMEFYISQITRAQEEERKRIAREIHDELCQSLATLGLEIDALARTKERLPEDVIQHLLRIRADTDKILEGLRHFSQELRPGEIDHVGLVPALEILTEEMNRVGRVNTSLKTMGLERRLAPEVELVLFRITQEALRNVRRHSGATKAAVRVKFTDRKVKLTVSDNGMGFKLPEKLSDFAAKGKLGLIGMQERARLLDSKFSVKSMVGRGTTVAVEVDCSTG